MGYNLLNEIIDSLHNGQIKQAKEMLQKGCRTLPEVQAYRLARVCCALIDPDGYHQRADLAVVFLKCFKR